ncbi:MAG TPA: hypothetical protein VKO84_00045 [Gaiellaceae bacterium]|nr:hypothetical protein [Gaiellaceae bacterium]
MTGADGIGRRVAARDALAARTRTLTAGAVAVSAILSGLFAGIAASSAPGHKLLHGTLARRTQSRTAGKVAASTSSSAAIPPLPAPPGPGNGGSASPSAPAPAPAPSASQSSPAVVSGSS